MLYIFSFFVSVDAQKSGTFMKPKKNVKKRSPIWEAFHLDKYNSDYAICDLCGDRVTRKGKTTYTTSYLIRHFKCHHKDLDYRTYKKEEKATTDSKENTSTQANKIIEENDIDEHKGLNLETCTKKETGKIPVLFYYFVEFYLLWP